MKINDIKKQILNDANEVDHWLENYFVNALSTSQQLIDAMKYSVLSGGKRIRASLVLSGARLAGNEIKALPVAAAIEMVHSYSLIHDDLPAMDDSDLRRGRLSLHKKFGEATAILAGDALQAEAFFILSNQKYFKNPSKQVKLISILSQAIGHNGMVGGQMLDMEGEINELDFQGSKIMQELKTGALIVASAVMGGIIGGANHEMQTALYNFSKNLGFAFQIADDILDVKSSPKKIGKPTGKDLEKEKSNFVNLLGLKKATEMANDLIEQAKKELILFESRGKELTNLADFVIAREK